MIAVLAGGTGGAKLARGLLDAVGGEGLAAIVNVADDVEVYGVHVSPDPDLVTYWLADLIDEERGYGIRGDSHATMAGLAAAGIEPWFELGDRDLATCLARTELLRGGGRLTEATARIARALGVSARVLPVTDDPVRTAIRSGESWLPFQEFMVRGGAAGPIEGVEVRGAREARPTPEAIAALAEAEAIVIGPSNPVISIGPILAIPGVREAIAGTGAPVVAVSPFVGGRAVKGPTDAFCRHAGLPLDAHTVLRSYGPLLDGVVADERVDEPGVASLVIDTLMDDPRRRSEVAGATLEFAASLAAGRPSPGERSR